MVDFSAEYESRFVPTPAPRVPLNTPRQRLINAAAIVVFDENVDLADSWEIEKRVVKVLDTLNDESVWAYWVTLGNSGMRRVVNAVIRAAYHETFERPFPHTAPNPRLIDRGETALGGRVLQRLHSVGIDAKRAHYNRRTQTFEIQFQPGNLIDQLTAGTDPAKVWGLRITAAFAGVEIVDGYDTVATWRPGSPIIFATVYARILE